MGIQPQKLLMQLRHYGNLLSAREFMRLQESTATASLDSGGSDRVVFFTNSKGFLHKIKATEIKPKITLELLVYCTSSKRWMVCSKG